MKKIAIGCGLVLILVLGASAFGIWRVSQWAKDSAPEFDEMAQRRTELLRTYGSEFDYLPPTDGAYDLARVDTYLEIREAISAEREELAARIQANIDWGMENPDPGFFESMGRIGDAVRIIGSIATHATITDSLLLEREMGLGEYKHYHATLFWGWMEPESERARWAEPLERLFADYDNDMAEAMLEMRDTVDEAASTLLRAHLENLVEASESAPSDSADAYLALIRSGDPDLPFADPLPPALEAAFEDRAVTIRMSAPESFSAWLAEMAIFIEFEANEKGTGVSREITVGF